MIMLVLIRLVTTALLMTWLGATSNTFTKSRPPGVTENQLVIVLRLMTVQSKNVSEWKLFKSLPGMISRSVALATDQPAGSVPSAMPSNVSKYKGGPNSISTYGPTVKLDTFVLVVTVPPLSLQTILAVCDERGASKPGGSYCTVVTAPTLLVVGVTVTLSKAN